jgi:hypothetical protein
MATGSRSASTAYLLINLMLLVLALGATVWIVGTVHGLVSGGSVPVHAQLPESRLHSVTLPSGIRIVGDPDVTLEIKDASSKQQLLSAAQGLGPAFLLFAGLWLLRGLAGSVREGDPFARANVQRLRSLGTLLVGGGLIVAVVEWALRLSLANTLPQNLFGGVTSQGFEFPLPWLLAGLGAFILAEVFAYGVSLREDVEATI